MNLNPVYAFLGGLAIGVVGGLYLAQKLIQKDYDERLEAEIDAAKRHYRDKKESNASSEQKKQAETKSETPIKQPKVELMPPVEPSTEPPRKYSSYAQEPMDPNSKEYEVLIGEYHGEGGDMSVKKSNKPFAIPYGDYIECNYPVEYGEEQLTYYEDGDELYNADGDLVDDWVSMIGDCINLLNQPNPDGSIPNEIFIQNDEDRMIYILSRS